MQVYWKNLKSVREKVTNFILWTFAAREVFPLISGSSLNSLSRINTRVLS